MRIADKWFTDKYFYYKGFIGTIETDEELGYHGKVAKFFYDNTLQQIEDSVNYHGDTVEQLFYQFSVAVDDYISMRNYYNIGETFFNKV